MSKNSPAYNIRLSLRSGREQTFKTFSGKDVTSKWRNVGAAWTGRYEETPYNLTFDKGTKLVLPDGTEYDLAECYLDLRAPYDPARKAGAPQAAHAPRKPVARKPPPADPFD